MSSEELEPQDETTATATEGEEAGDDAAAGEEKKKKLHLAVDLSDVGPCRKRLKITIPPEDISGEFNDQFTELVENAEIPGFRPGHAPRRLIEKKYRKDVSEQVKRNLLMKSLEQVGEEHKLAVISEPKIDFTAITVPETGPMVYEFEVEVSPEFELPNYKDIKIKRPTKEFGEADVQKQLKRFLHDYAQLVPKTDPAVAGDHVVVDVVFRDGETEISKAEELSIRLQPVLRFRDGTIEKFDKAMIGVKIDDVRKLPVAISSEAPNESLRGRTIEAEFKIKDLKRLRLPEVNDEFLVQIGYKTEIELRDALHSVLRRRLEFEQRRSARQQLLAALTQAVKIDLPQDLVKRQVQTTIRRRVMELQEAGLSQDEIRRRSVELQQQSFTTTQQSLREHFLLAKIAETEELEVTPKDIETQIEVMAMQSDESPRRVRSRLEKEGLMDTLEIQLLEQIACDRALEYAQYEDAPWVEPAEPDEEAVDQSAATTPEDEAKQAEGEPAAAAESAETKA